MLKRRSVALPLGASSRPPRDFRVAINPLKLPHSRNRTNGILTGKPAFRLAPRAVRSMGVGCEASQARGRSSPVAGVGVSGKQRVFRPTSVGPAPRLRCSKGGGPPPALATNNTELGKSCFVLSDESGSGSRGFWALSGIYGGGGLGWCVADDSFVPTAV